MKSVPFLLASLVAGIIMALLSNLPIVSALNCILCLWMWVGGILSVVFYRMFDKDKPKLSPGQGTLLGLTGGAIGGLLTAIYSYFTVSSAVESAILSLQSSPELWAIIEPYAGALSGISLASIGCNFLFYVLFGMLGGLLGAAMTRGRKSVAAEWDATFDKTPPATSYFDAPAVVQSAEFAKIVEPAVEEFTAPVEPEEPMATDQDVQPPGPAA